MTQEQTPQTKRKEIAIGAIFVAALVAAIGYFFIGYESKRAIDAAENYAQSETKRPIIAAGLWHSLAFDNDGRLYATGDNSKGQLGLGEAVKHSVAFTRIKPLGDKNVTAIAVGAFHSLAIDADGKIYATGHNRHGQLGLDDNKDRKTWTLVSSFEGKSIIAISAGVKHSLALDSDGKLYATGDNSKGQLGLGNRDHRKTWTLIPLLGDKNVTAIAVGAFHSLAIDADGKIYATGWNNDGQLGLGDSYDRETFTPVSSLKSKKIIAISAGFNHSLALDSEGKIYAAGGNKYGQLGLDNNVSRDVWTLVSPLKHKKIIAISAGGEYSSALDSDGKLYTTGHNEYGELGLGDNKDRKTWTLVSSLKDKKIIAISAGIVCLLALDSDGKLHATGNNDKGQLGLYRNLRKSWALVFSLDDKRIVAVTAGKSYSLALDADGKLYATGFNGNGELGLGNKDGRDVFTLVKPLGDKNVTAIAASVAHSLALTGEGKVYATGNNYYGQLGFGDSGDETDRNAFLLASSLSDKKIVAVAAGDYHSLALDSDGKVYATGRNDDGQLGLGDRDLRKTWTFVESLEDKKIVAVAAGDDHSLALDSDGKVYATGRNDDGQLGLGDRDLRKTWTFVKSLEGKKVIAISAGVKHSLALDVNGAVYATGYNYYGQSGLGGATWREIWTLVSLPDEKQIVAIAAGEYHSLALDSDGGVCATGANANGQLGLGDYDNRKSFMTVSSLKDKKIVAVAGGGEHSLALSSEGKVYATGNSKAGRLGMGDEAAIATFTLVPSFSAQSAVKISPSDKRIVAVAAGDYHSLALDANGAVYATGKNERGQLGLDDNKNRKTWTFVPSLEGKKIVAVAAGDHHSLALDKNGKVYAAGSNYKELGLSDMNDISDRKTFTFVHPLSDKKIIAISAGDYHSLALDNEGKVYATGGNEDGRLGLDDNKDRKTWTFVPSLEGKKIVAIAAGKYHSLTLDSEGKVYATGLNEYGELGLGDSGFGNDRNSFTPVSSLEGKKIVAIAAGDDYSLALDKNGKVYAAGASSAGKLGADDSYDRETFAPVSSLEGKKIVAMTDSFVIDSEGKFYAAGYNRYGQLGLGDENAREVWTLVPSLSDKKIMAIARSDGRSFAIDELGKLYATGNNLYGQLGLGDNDDRNVFTPALLFDR